MSDHGSDRVSVRANDHGHASDHGSVRVSDHDHASDHVLKTVDIKIVNEVGSLSLSPFTLSFS